MYGNNDYRDYLMHHGIKDQKWGVKNGPPYPLNTEGKKKFLDRLADRRKAKRKQEALKKARKTRAKNVAAKEKEQARLKKSTTALSPTPIKSIKKMSTTELEARIKRLQMEKQLRDLESGEKSRAKKMIEDALYDAGKQLITQTVKDVGLKYIKEAFDFSSGGDNEQKKENQQNQQNQQQSKGVTKTTVIKEKDGKKEKTTTVVKKR